MIGERPATRTRDGWTVALGLALSAFVLEGCNSSGPLQFRGTTASSFLRTVEESKDPNARYKAYADLAAMRVYDDEGQKVRAAQVLAAKLREGKEPIATRAVICRTLGQLGKPEAREVVLAATSDEDALVRAEACRALGRVGRSEDGTVLARVMTLDVSAECRLAAIESLGDLRSQDRRITQYLVTGMEHDEPAIRVASWNALKAITGKDLGVDAMKWKKYVESLPDPSGLAAPARPIALPDAGPSTVPPLPPEIP